MYTEFCIFYLLCSFAKVAEIDLEGSSFVFFRVVKLALLVIMGRFVLAQVGLERCQVETLVKRLLHRVRRAAGVRVSELLGVCPGWGTHHHTVSRETLYMIHHPIYLYSASGYNY